MAFFSGERMQNLIQQAHPQWHEILARALSVMDKHYLEGLGTDKNWLPGASLLFAAFSLPLSSTRYILLGESPYPRATSANGYAFWDSAVGPLWSEKGLSKEVNRATSLRNFIKMLLRARGDLSTDCSQAAIANLDKSHYVQTGEQLFTTLINKGFLLLNASLVYSDGQVNFHARHWRPFIASLLTQLTAHATRLQLILFGRIAEQVPQRDAFRALVAEHPYNISFITNPQVMAFFNPLDLLVGHD